MKIKLLLIAIALFIGIQLKMSITSENQSWADYFRSKWNAFTSSRQIKSLQERATYLLPTIAVGSQTASYALTSAIPEQATEITRKILEKDNTQIVLYTTIALGVLATTIYGIITYYKTGSWSRTDAVIRIKDVVRALINDQLVYPTRSSKLHTLLKRDEFSQYITDEYGLVQEACTELAREINDLPYPQEKDDEIIDNQMAEIKNILQKYPTLAGQIIALEDYRKQKDHFEIFEMRAYLSVYYRLQNKDNIESKLSSEELASRKPWTQEAKEKYLTSEGYWRKQQQTHKTKSEQESLKRIAKEETEKENI